MRNWKGLYSIAAIPLFLLAVEVVAQNSIPAVVGSPAHAPACSLLGFTPNANQRVQDLLGAYNSQAAMLRTLEASVIVRSQGRSSL
jgi:hypothetical protein